jgi:hypothetical protein
VSKSFAGLQARINEVSQTKGLVEGKKAGKIYCDEWKKEVEMIKMNLVMEQNRLPASEYNKKVADFNKKVAEMNMGIGAFYKMVGTK